MELINHAKNILLSPKNSWASIEAEQNAHTKIAVYYLLLLALIPAIGSFIGYGLVGHSVLGVRIGGTLSWGLRQAVVSYISMVGGAYLTAFIINLLAESFGSVKNCHKAFALVVYAYTPMCVAGVLYIFPVLSTLALIAGLYGLYILYTGMQPMMKTPAEKVSGYFIVSLLCVIVVSFALSWALSATLLSTSAWL